MQQSYVVDAKEYLLHIYSIWFESTCVIYWFSSVLDGEVNLLFKWDKTLLNEICFIEWWLE